MSVQLRTRLIACTAVSLGVVWASAGCGGSEAATEKGATPGGSAVAGATQQGPQAVLNEALESELKVRELIIRLTESCLRSKGVNNFPRRSARSDDGVTAEPRTSPLLEQARVKGYGVTEEVQPDAPAEPEFTFASAEEERRYLKALTGRATAAAPANETSGRPTLGGCTGEARSAAYGQVAAPESPTTKIREAAQAEYAKDSTLKVVLKNWSLCLEKADYPKFEDPEDVARYAQYFHYPAGIRPGGTVPAGGPWPPATALKKEVALAVADAGCADQGGLRDAQKRAWTKALKNALAQYETQVFGYRDAMSAALKRGQQALQG
ncbi:hypothetical protein [Micromonospora sp. RTGN7]|uniref:hypothetical protein n=1 Tax=Micromonospora sp. RTGN7 TaxID=3016526 RepID=UPI0029FF50A1|nr:hypothetical protein [Micromonospora sp. RTGN7]